MISIDIDEEQTAKVVLESLQGDMEFIENEELIDAMHKVIAWYSVPGEYQGGQYDLNF